MTPICLPWLSYNSVKRNKKKEINVFVVFINVFWTVLLNLMNLWCAFIFDVHIHKDTKKGHIVHLFTALYYEESKIQTRSRQLL